MDLPGRFRLRQRREQRALGRIDVSARGLRLGHGRLCFRFDRRATAREERVGFAHLRQETLDASALFGLFDVALHEPARHPERPEHQRRHEQRGLPTMRSRDGQLSFVVPPRLRGKGRDECGAPLLDRHRRRHDAREHVEGTLLVPARSELERVLVERLCSN